MKRVRLSKRTIAASRAEPDPGKALLIVWHAVEPEFDTLPTVDPTAYGIPRSQATELLTDRADVGGFGGLWLNIGPSSFPDEECPPVRMQRARKTRKAGAA